MPKYRTCEREGCENVFDYADHKDQRFCSKSCAKKGTRNRSQGAEASRPGQMEQALAAVADGLSFRKAGERFGLPPSSVHVAAQRTNHLPAVAEQSPRD